MKTFEEFINEDVNEGKVIDSFTIRALGTKLLPRIKIGTKFVTDKDTYTVTDFGPKANAFQEFYVDDSKGNSKKVKFTVIYSVSFKIEDDPKSALYHREEVLKSIEL